MHIYLLLIFYLICHFIQSINIRAVSLAVDPLFLSTQVLNSAVPPFSIKFREYMYMYKKSRTKNVH